MAYAGQKEIVWDKKLEPLMKFITGKKGIKTKSANEVGRRKVDYFRGKDFCNFLLKDAEKTKRRCHQAIKEHLSGKTPDDDDDCCKLGNELLNKKFIVKAVYQPFGSNQPESQTKKKWPDRLARVTHKNGFDLDGFYIIEYTGPKGMQYFLMVLILIGVMCGIMFPVWPIWAKIGGWYILVILSTIYLFLQVIRLILFVILWVVGTDFWLFPNLNDDSLGVVESFIPTYAYRKRKDEFGMIFVRLFCLVFLVISTNEISRTHSLSDLSDLMTGSYEDIIDWGKERLTALPGGTNNIPLLEDIEREMLAAEEEEKKEAEAKAKGEKVEADGGMEDVDDKEDYEKMKNAGADAEKKEEL